MPSRRDPKWRNLRALIPSQAQSRQSHVWNPWLLLCPWVFRHLADTPRPCALWQFHSLLPQARASPQSWAYSCTPSTKCHPQQWEFWCPGSSLLLGWNSVSLACFSRLALMRANKGSSPKRCSQVAVPCSAQCSPLLWTPPGDLPDTFLPVCSWFSASLLDCDLCHVRVLAAQNVPGWAEGNSKIGMFKHLKVAVGQQCLTGLLCLWWSKCLSGT